MPGHILLVLGAGAFCAILGAWVFKRIGIPQVVGYIVVGLVAGESGLQLVKTTDIHKLGPVVIFALGVIGFLVGGELRLAEFRKYARQYSSIMLGGGLGALIPVGLSTGIIVWWLGAGWAAAVAAGCVFGAIAAATDPASTISVLWEYRAKGAVTNALTAVIVLDAALAIGLYSLSTGIALTLFGGSGGFWHEIGTAVGTLLGALILGGATALLLQAILGRLQWPSRNFPLTLCALITVSAAGDALGLDVILTAMAMGCVTVNLNPMRSERMIAELRGFSLPVYAIFFFFIGAQLSLGSLPGWLWAIVGAYVICRTFGKIAGAWASARLSGGSRDIGRFVGMGLSTQGGVAIGLSSTACLHFSNVELADGLSLGQAVVFAITATTLIVQLTGPSLVKLAVRWAGEIGRDVKEEDVIHDMKVADVMEAGVEPVLEGESLDKVMRRFSRGEYMAYPVVDDAGNIQGMVSLSSMKELIIDRDTWQWMLAGDVMEPVHDFAIAEGELATLLQRMTDRGQEQIPVVEHQQTSKLAGMLRRERVRKLVAEETVRRQGVLSQPT